MSFPQGVTRFSNWGQIFSLAQEAEGWITVTGQSLLRADRAEVRKAAQNDGFRRTLEKFGVRVQVIQETCMFLLVKDEVRLDFTGFVSDYREIHSFGKDGVFFLTLQVKVKPDSKEKMDAFRRLWSDRSILVIVRPKWTNDPCLDQASVALLGKCARRMEKFLIEQGLRVRQGDVLKESLEDLFSKEDEFVLEADYTLVVSGGVKASDAGGAGLSQYTLEVEVTGYLTHIGDKLNQFDESDRKPLERVAGSALRQSEEEVESLFREEVPRMGSWMGKEAARQLLKHVLDYFIQDIFLVGFKGYPPEELLSLREGLASLQGIDIRRFNLSLSRVSFATVRYASGARLRLFVLVPSIKRGTEYRKGIQSARRRLPGRRGHEDRDYVSHKGD